MSVMGSQLEIDMDPDGDLTVVPRHQGQTGTGCYKLHDHRIIESNHNYVRKGPAFRAAPGGGVPDNSAFETGDPNTDLKFAPHHVQDFMGSSGQDGPGPPNGGPGGQPHLLDMPIQQGESTGNGHHRVLKQLNSPGKKSMVRAVV